MMTRSISNDSEESASVADSAYYTVAITGSSGLLGTALIDELSKKQKEHLLINGKPLKIVKLIRPCSSQAVPEDGEDDEEKTMITSVTWNPDPNSNVEGSHSSAIIDPTADASLESIDTIVHLAGENVGSGLLPFPLGVLGVQAWSKEKKELIMNSRVGPTKALANAIANCSNTSSSSSSSSSTNSKSIDFIVASGVGVYGNDFIKDENNDDSSSSSSSCPDESFDISKTTGFLAEVSRQWEAASQPAIIKEDGVSNNNNRLVNLRIAPILSKFGGALGKLYPIFFLGGGGIVGSGNQYFSYISARDAARAIVHIIETPSLSGPVNLVAPTPCTNAEFTSAMGKVLSRPTIIPLPAFVVKLLFGEMGEEMLLGGVKATPKKLVQSGFKFQHETVEKAIESAVKETI